LDDNYQIYLNRIARMMLPEAYRSQIQHIQESAKFRLTPQGTREAIPFPGYTVITPPWENDSQSTFYSTLQIYQQQLLTSLSNLIVPVPSASFHMTLADLIWDNAYRDACLANPKFEEELRFCFASIFQQYQESMTSNAPIRWQMLGLLVMPRAVGVCLVPQDENSYEQIISLRRKIFQNAKLMELAIEQHYHFTAHVTLGYFAEVSNLDHDVLADKFIQLNQQWLDNLPEFTVQRAELRKFDDMNRFYRESDFPVLEWR